MFAATLLLAALARQDPPQLEASFVEGDLADLSARIVASEVDGASALLTIEVKNKGRVAFEPLAFDVTAPPHGQREELVIRRLERAPFPHLARVGRPVPARGKQRYTLQVGI